MQWLTQLLVTSSLLYRQSMTNLRHMQPVLTSVFKSLYIPSVLSVCLVSVTSLTNKRVHMKQSAALAAAF